MDASLEVADVFRRLGGARFPERLEPAPGGRLSRMRESRLAAYIAFTILLLVGAGLCVWSIADRALGGLLWGGLTIWISGGSLLAVRRNRSLDSGEKPPSA